MYTRNRHEIDHWINFFRLPIWQQIDAKYNFQCQFIHETPKLCLLHIHKNVKTK
jgi:hypothetical protein